MKDEVMNLYQLYLSLKSVFFLKKESFVSSGRILLAKSAEAQNMLETFVET